MLTQKWILMQVVVVVEPLVEQAEINTLVGRTSILHLLKVDKINLVAHFQASLEAPHPAVAEETQMLQPNFLLVIVVVVVVV
jgi:hypothetical protein